jgi:glycogen debranching enzyme
MEWLTVAPLSGFSMERGYAMIKMDQESCRNLETALSRKWLETNGIGGFSSSTIVGLNTRRYHGLLTAATKPPVGSLVLLSKLEESLIIDGRRYELSANQYPGAVHPQGFHYQTGFRLDPFPRFTYEIQGVRLGQVSEIFDGDVPHTPRGCVAQAWSVAELLRVAIENVYSTIAVGQAASTS